ncbi:MAG: tetratricopeptide repeat protein [Saprospiraceae bacterium]|nr:tetratricopeptide repeat protein [Saprospiraceae bacterium]
MPTITKDHLLQRKIKTLVEERNLAEALLILGEQREESREVVTMKALCHFMMEDYDLALSHYRKALQLDPHNAELLEMLQRSEENVSSKIDQQVPEIYFFKDEQKPAPAVGGNATLPPVQVKTWIRICNWISQAIGNILNVIVDSITLSWGKIAGYRNKIWTNWYRRPLFLGILTLGYMRTRLNKFNLISTYPGDHLVGFIDAKNHKATSDAVRFRTADGSWNDLQNPLEGAAKTRFLRNTSLDVKTDDDSTLMTPNPRELSLTFLSRKGPMPEVPFLNMLSVAWIQFQNHDWISYGETTTNEVHTIPMPSNDPARARYWQTKLFVGKTQQDPWRVKKDCGQNTYLNECTHWWDGSQIYGSDQETQNRLRSWQNGKLRTLPNGLLPKDKKGVEETGFVRNWWLGLGMMHTLFVNEHNAICDHLQLFYPNWDDHQLFHTARLINAALMAKIHSLEWNAAINPNKALYQGIQSNWYGLLSSWFDSSAHKKTVNTIRVRNAELGGILGNSTQKYGSPFGLTQEFVEVYRMHSLLPESLQIKDLNSSKITDLPIASTRQAASGKFIDQFGLPNLFYSFGTQNPGQLVLNNYPRFMQELSIPGNPVYDLGAVDILRARERGVPRYNAFRRAMGLKAIRRFEDLTSDQEYVRLLKNAYQNNIELIDLMIGALAEDKRPEGFAFGETIFQIFLLNATRRLQADRFYTTCYTPEYYTQEGLDWIDQNNLKSVLLRHHPRLGTTGLANIRNAFEPWDEGEDLDPERHPLRAFDRSLRKDPWQGDAAS